MNSQGPTVGAAEFHRVGGVGPPAGAVDTQGLAVATDVGPLQKPQVANQSHAGAGAECPPAVAEQPDLVPRLVVEGDKAVQLENIPVEGGAVEGAGGGAMSPAVEYQLRGAIRRHGQNRPGEAAHRRVVLLLAAEPEAVAAQDQPFHGHSPATVPGSRLRLRSRIRNRAGCSAMARALGRAGGSPQIWLAMSSAARGA